MREHVKQAVTAAALIVAASVTACSDRQAANASNFQMAIQRYLDTQPLCVEVPLSDLPGEAPGGGLHQQQLDALTEVGLLDAQCVTLARRNGTGAEARVPGYRYTMTGKGAEFLSGSRSVYSGQPQLCVGKPTVTRIVHFSEAPGQQSVQSRQVVYAYEFRTLLTARRTRA